MQPSLFIRRDNDEYSTFTLITYYECGHFSCEYDVIEVPSHIALRLQQHSC